MNSDRSEGSDAEMEGFTIELEKLQQKFRIMEGDRHAYAVESQEQIRRQLREVELLKSERIEMEKKLALAESRQNQMMDETAQKKIEDLINEREMVNEQIIIEETNQEKLINEIEDLQVKIQEEKKKAGGLDKLSKFMKDTDKLKKTLENRLHLSTEKFNKACTENNKKRESIETLRIDKSNFLHKYRKEEKVLKDLKKDIRKLTEQSTTAYEQRDDAHNKMFMLKDKCEKDIQLFNAEIRELQRIIDDDKKRRNFMKSKEVTRQVTFHATKKEKDSKRLAEEKITNYETAFQAIIDCSGKDDISSVVANFIKVEDRNFALFNLVNEQNNVIEQLTDEIKLIKKNISDYKNEDVKMRDDRKKIMEELELELKQTQNELQQSEEMLKNVQKILGQLKLGTGSLFSKIGCNEKAMQHLLGGHLGVEDDNVMKYLGVIEQRTNHLLLSSVYIDSQQNFESYDPYETAKIIVGQLPQDDIRPLSVDPPSTGDDKDIDDSRSDDELHPFTAEELKLKVLATVEKKELEATKSHGGTTRYDVTAQIRRR